jgi:predicted NUDIX family NTP pyrophosphohydrolase
MPAKLSAGLLLYRFAPDGGVEVLIGHMGGPFWARKDDGGWSIPKGEYEPDEDPFQAALREFEEELGSPCPGTAFEPLGEARMPSGKRLTVWAAEGDFDCATARSNTFAMEWPKGSGRMQDFPEIDKAEWFPVDSARSKLLKGHVVFLDRLLERLPPS